MAVITSHGTLRMALAFTLSLASLAMARAQTYSVLYSFSGGADGGTPGPVNWAGATGSLYGVTTDGGSGGYGTVFEISSSGVESVLYSFAGPPNDGLAPNDVFLDMNGNFFGTTLSGGQYWGEGGDGIVFKINPKGAEKVLHSFRGGADGSEPTSGLIQDPNTSDFYGVTVGGGTDGVGTLYKMTASGTETVLYTFGQGGDQPSSKLVQDVSTGNLYGLLGFGGPWGCGGSFSSLPPGWKACSIFLPGSAGTDASPGRAIRD